MFRPGIIGYNWSTFLLNLVPSARGAYSLRLLKSDYAGSCIRVRRSSDSTSTDIWFVNNILDTASLLTFCWVGNGFVSKWYDQSWNTKDLAQATTALQPQIVSSWSVLTDWWLPCIQFTNSSNWFMSLPTGELNSATALTLVGAWNIDTSASADCGVFWPSTTSWVGLEIVSNVSSVYALRFNGTDRITATNQMFTDDTRYLTEVYWDTTSVAAYGNWAVATLSDTSAMPTLNFNGVYALAKYKSGSANDTTMKCQELVYWLSNKAPLRQIIENNINKYRTIY